MSAPAGYKATEVGVIPHDWDVATAGTHSDILTGFPFPSAKFAESGIRLIRGSNVKRDEIDWSDDIAQYWPRETRGLTRYLLQEGDILIAMDGALVGRSYAELTAKHLPALLVQRVARLRGKGCNQKYLGFWVRSSRFSRHCDELKTNTAIPHISPADIRSFQIALPPSEAEQTAIAEALSDVDEAIAAQEAVIAKKRALKTATMQALLSGTRRLPGFSGEWEVKALGDVAQIDRDNLGSSTSPNYTFRYISLEDVDRGSLRQTTQQTFATAPSRARRRVAAGDVLFGTVRPNLQSHALISDDAEDLVCSTGFAVIRCDASKADPKFVFFNLFGGFVEKQVERLLAGSNYPAISNKDVAAIEIKAPNVEEQRSIADVIFDMDEDVNRQIAKLAKLRDLKTGMMQQLLTGKIRLV